MAEHRQEQHVHLDVCGRQYAVGSPECDEAIAFAYSTRKRPRCLCRPEGVEMYVSRFGDDLVVKRMPETGHLHAPSCPSFEVSPELTGLSKLLHGAITENPASGETALRLDFSLSRSAARPHRQPSAESVATPSRRTTRLTLGGLLHFLWDQGELSHWHPGFEGKRQWSTVRRQLLRAASQKIVCGRPLQELLYVPEPFFAEDEGAILARQRSSWARACRGVGAQQGLMLFIAELKAISPSRHGHHAVLRHVPNIAFALDDKLYGAVCRSADDELNLWGASVGIKLMAAGTFALNTAGVPSIYRICLMPVTKHWLPVDNAQEQSLVEALIRERRSFRKLLRYGLRRASDLACVAIADRGEPVPLLFADEQKPPT